MKPSKTICLRVFRSIIARHLTLNFPLCPHSFFAVWVGVWVKPQSTSGKAIKRKPKSLLKICAAKQRKGFTPNEMLYIMIQSIA